AENGRDAERALRGKTVLLAEDPTDGASERIKLGFREVFDLDSSRIEFSRRPGRRDDRDPVLVAMREQHALRGDAIDRVDDEVRTAPGFLAREDLVARVVVEELQDGNDLRRRVDLPQALSDRFGFLGTDRTLQSV